MHLKKKKITTNSLLQSLFMATTYAGYIGVITGAKDGAFSVTGDQRNKGKIWENLLSALEESWPTFMLQRTVTFFFSNKEK